MKRSLLGVAALLALAISASADNLITNGDFSAGNTGFTSQYQYVPGNGTIFTFFGDYSVVDNPGTAFLNGYASFGDHTTGTGLMLFVDGDDPSLNAWSETVNAAAGPAMFTAWVANPDSILINPAQIGLFVNGVQEGATFNLTGGSGEWQEWTISFDFDHPGQENISIRNMNPDYFDAGDDFVLDDISLTQQTTPEPSTILMLAGGIATLFTFKSRYRA